MAESTPATGRLRLPALLFTAFVCGAAVMVIEVMGSRVIGPFYGVSLFVWTALITVTMVALAAGYAAGGWLADRRPALSCLYGIILAAGILTLSVPGAKGPVLEATVPLGLRAGALVSAALLFGPPLFLLGCVSPYLVRAAAGEMRRIGSTVGNLYAVSTVGSVAGTAIAGFVLLAYLGVDRIFQVTGAALVLLGAAHFASNRRFWPLAWLAFVPLAGFGTGAPGAHRLPNGTVAAVVDASEGFYGSVKVVDYRHGANHVREMMIDGLIQGGLDLRSGLPTYEYFYLLQSLPRTVRPGGRSCLVIGLGAGLVPAWYARHGVDTAAVDINPDVVRFARRHFGLPLDLPVYLDDARTFLALGDRRYDYLILDVFTGDATPPHLLSLESFRAARSRLTPQGVLAVNFMADLGENSLGTASVARTLGEVFATVEIYPTFDPTDQDHGNVVLLAYDGPPAQVPPGFLADEPVQPMAAAVRGAVAWRFSFARGVRAEVLTDDFNPVDLWEAPLRERLRSALLRDIPRPFLL